MLTVQEPMPVHAPFQPPNSYPIIGVAVSVTVLPMLKLLVQLAPHAIPAGDEATEPRPLTVMESG